MNARPKSNVASLREREGLTQQQLADAVDVVESTIRNWEKGRNGIEWFVRVANLCDALDCSPHDLIRYEDDHCSK